MLDVHGSLQLLHSSHVRERDKALLRSVMVGGVWNGLLLGRVRSQVIPCRFCGGTDGDGHLFWECPYPPLVGIRENPEFHDLMAGIGGESPWAVGTDDAAVYMLESALGSYSSDNIQGWDVPNSVDWDSAADRVPPSPDVWTDGSLEVSGSAFAGAGVYARLHADNWRYPRWAHFDDLGLTPDGLSSSCVGFCSLPGPLHTAQRAEFWGVLLALQPTNAVHLAGYECCSPGC